jgi:hypothetical protein
MINVSRFFGASVWIACCVLAGCGGGSSQQAAPAAAAPASPLVFAGGKRPNPPAGCEWVLKSVAMPGDEFLLYLAAQCKGKTRELQYSGGAHRAELKFEENQPAVVEIRGAEPGQGKQAVEGHVRGTLNKAEAARCFVRPARNEFFPADALVVDVSDAEAAKAPKNEPRSACGNYGMDEDSQSFWRVFQGYAWYFNLGQDEPEIDPGSLTLARKDAAGKWVALGQ